MYFNIIRFSELYVTTSLVRLLYRPCLYRYEQRKYLNAAFQILGSEVFLDILQIINTKYPKYSDPSLRFSKYFFKL